MLLKSCKVLNSVNEIVEKSKKKLKVCTEEKRSEKKFFLQGHVTEKKKWGEIYLYHALQWGDAGSQRDSKENTSEQFKRNKSISKLIYFTCDKILVADLQDYISFNLVIHMPFSKLSYPDMCSAEATNLFWIFNVEERVVGSCKMTAHEQRNTVIGEYNEEHSCVPNVFFSAQCASDGAVFLKLYLVNREKGWCFRTPQHNDKHAENHNPFIYINQQTHAINNLVNYWLQGAATLKPSTSPIPVGKTWPACK